MRADNAVQAPFQTNPICQALTRAMLPTSIVVAAKGELAPLRAQPAVSAAVTAAGVTPIADAFGKSGAMSDTDKMGFMPIWPVIGISQTRATSISQPGKTVRS